MVCSKYFLRDWPFRVSASEEFSDIWADREALKKDLGHVSKAVMRGPSQIKLLWGFFGAGKTHTLYYSKRRLEKENCFVVFTRYSAEFRTFLSVFFEFMKNFDFDKFEKKLQAFWRKNDEKEIEQFFKKKVSGEWTDFYNFVRTIANPDDKETYVIARRWINGESLGKRDRATIQVLDNISDDVTASRIIYCIGRFWTAVTKRPFVWMIDEFENLGELQDRYRIRVLDGIKNVYDNLENFSLFISFKSANPQSAIGFLTGAIEDRLPRDPFIKIPQLTIDEAREFVTDLLKQFRSKKPPDEYFPFTKESIEAVLTYIDQTAGVDLTPREIMRHFQDILNKADDDNIIRGYRDRITTDYVVKILQRI